MTESALTRETYYVQKFFVIIREIVYIFHQKKHISKITKDIYLKLVIETRSRRSESDTYQSLRIRCDLLAKSRGLFLR